VEDRILGSLPGQQVAPPVNNCKRSFHGQQQVQAYHLQVRVTNGNMQGVEAGAWLNGPEELKQRNNAKNKYIHVVGSLLDDVVHCV
jgi:hypothetical protein